MSGPVFSLHDLCVNFETRDGTVSAVTKLSFDVRAGETLAVVGESGSGKSQAMMAIMGLLAENGRATGSAEYLGRNLLGMKKSDLNQIRGACISMIFQEPMTSLDPLYRVGEQVAETIRRHQGKSFAEARAHALEMFRLVSIPDPERRMDSYPHELSGGQRQRVMIAMALANSPDILIADEPTTALDVTIQAEILDLIKSLQTQLNMAVILISHDLNVVRRVADRVCVMRDGRLIENGQTAAVFASPRHPYTRALIDSEPKGFKEPPPHDAPVVLKCSNISVSFQIGGKFLSRAPRILRAVDDVSITLRQGQTIGIIGESGSGKSTLARALLRLIPSQGTFRLDGEDITHRDKAAMRPLRRKIQIVMQDPFGSLSPRMTAGQIVSEGLRVQQKAMSIRDLDREAAKAFEHVQLDPNLRNRYPHEFSGGQRQRIAIARAIILKPQVIVLDEPTSALDRQVQQQILALLRDLQEKNTLSYIFISHDLAVVRALSDHVMVMRDGQVLEQGSPDMMIRNPQHDYTRRLVSAAFLTVS